jgi:plastocyanin
VPTYTITFTKDLTITPSATATVKVGTKVIWKNDDPFKPHTIQSDNMQTISYFGGRGTVEIPYGKTYEVIFDKVGSYDYSTGPFQPQQQAKIVVTA